MPLYLTFIRLFRRLRAKKQLGLLLVLGLLVMSLLGNAVCFYTFDGASSEVSFADAMWYSVISITTIGYGDYSATSMGARVGTVVFIVLVGMAAFTVFLGIVVDGMTQLAMKGQFGMGTALASDHCLIVNFPSEPRVRRLVQELRGDPAFGDGEIIIVSDRVERLPFDEPKLLFVRGNPLESETFTRASIGRARSAIVLATGYDDPNSDAVVSSIISVIDSLNPDVRVVAECLDDRHELLFQAVHCDALVNGMNIADHLLVQETHDPGLSQMVDEITSNCRGLTLFTAEVAADPAYDGDYCRLAKDLLDRDVNVLAVNRGSEARTSFRDIHPEPGDSVVYLADHRYDWSGLLAEVGRQA
jgi:voltage-gated potassium channel